MIHTPLPYFPTLIIKLVYTSIVNLSIVDTQ